MANELTRLIMANLAGHTPPVVPPEAAPSGRLSQEEQELLAGAIRAGAAPIRAAGSVPESKGRAISLEELARLRK